MHRFKLKCKFIFIYNKAQITWLISIFPNYVLTG